MIADRKFASKFSISKEVHEEIPVPSTTYFDFKGLRDWGLQHRFHIVGKFVYLK